MVSIYFQVILLASVYNVLNAFAFNFGSFRTSSTVGNRQMTPLAALDNEVITKLETMKAKYDSLASVDSAEAVAEKAELEDVVQKYSTYKEIKLMMGKLRTMWRTEESERRRTRQLNSFVSLAKGKNEIEGILKEKLGYGPANANIEVAGYSTVQKLDAEILELEKKLSEVEIKLPEGMSTREERFGLGIR